MYRKSKGYWNYWQYVIFGRLRSGTRLTRFGNEVDLSGVQECRSADDNATSILPKLYTLNSKFYTLLPTVPPNIQRLALPGAR